MFPSNTVYTGFPNVKSISDYFRVFAQLLPRIGTKMPDVYMCRARGAFLCEHDSARSQMAEGLLKHLYGDKYEVFSAGSNPTQVDPFAIKVMAEIEIDISKQTSKNISARYNSYIVTLDARLPSNCPNRLLCLVEESLRTR